MKQSYHTFDENVRDYNTIRNIVLNLIQIFGFFTFEKYVILRPSNYQLQIISKIDFVLIYGQIY